MIFDNKYIETLRELSNRYNNPSKYYRSVLTYKTDYISTFEYISNGLYDTILLLRDSLIEQLEEKSDNPNYSIEYILQDIFTDGIAFEERYIKSKEKNYKLKKRILQEKKITEEEFEIWLSFNETLVEFLYPEIEHIPYSSGYLLLKLYPKYINDTKLNLINILKGYHNTQFVDKVETLINQIYNSQKLENLQQTPQPEKVEEKNSLLPKTLAFPLYIYFKGRLKIIDEEIEFNASEKTIKVIETYLVAENENRPKESQINAYNSVRNANNYSANLSKNEPIECKSFRGIIDKVKVRLLEEYPQKETEILALIEPYLK